MIRIDSTEIQALSRQLARVAKNYESARTRVLSTTRARTQTVVKREIAKVYSLPQRRIADGLRFHGIDKVNLSFTISASKRVIGLQNFAHRSGQKAGVTVQVLKGKGYRAASNKRGFSKAFKQTGRGFGGGANAQRIFQRTSYKRLPMISLYGPSVADMLSRATVYKEIADFATARISSELQRHIAVALNG